MGGRILYNIKPDVMVFGKALTNGLSPLAAIWAKKKKIIKPTVFHSSLKYILNLLVTILASKASLATMQ